MEDKSINRKRIFLALMIAWMVVIFSFSARNANESTDDSNLVINFICENFITGFEELSEDDKLEIMESMTYPIRKLAHAAEYAILGMLAFGAFLNDKNDKKNVRKSAFAAWITATLYAATDEVHQYFVPGRYCAATDVAIDSAGAVVGILFIILLINLRRKYKS